MEERRGGIWGGYYNSRYSTGSPPVSRRFKRRIHERILALMSAPPRPLAPAVDEKCTTDAYFTGIPFQNTGYIQHLDIVDRGDTANTREGKSFVDTSVQFDLSVFATALSPLNVPCFFCFVWDLAPHQALPAFSLIFPQTGVTWAGQSFFNRDMYPRFRVLYYRRFQLVNQAGSPDYSHGFCENVRLPFFCLAECVAGSTVGDITTRLRGALYLCMAGSASGTGISPATIRFRINFVDC